MKRLIEDDLLQWKQKKNDRMPLLLYGARQVGKTWLLQDFGKRHYQNSVYVNFERMSVLKDYFEGDLSPDRLLGLLEAYFQTKIHPGKTLLIFDEIQACERALTSLKYFCEDAPDIHVAAAGSLLGVAVHRQHFSFPVGKVLTKTLYPFRFDEFLSALSRDDLVKVIREHFADGSQMPKATHAELRYLLKTYLFVGGMPAVIRKYLEEESLINIPEMQGMILDAYTADMSKYATEGESTRIRGAFHSLPAQLAKENRKFQYKLIRKGATAGLFGDSIFWLVQSGVVLQCGRVTRGEMPLAAHRDLSAFKLYFSDVGLLSAKCGIQPENILQDALSDAFRGALTENFLAQTLRTNGYELYYWTSDKTQAEVDFVIQKEGCAIPLEVKSGERFHARSLSQYRKNYHPELILHLSDRNFGETDGVRSVPLYAAHLL